MLRHFVSHRTIAVVGAADDAAKLRGKLFKLAMNSDLSGPVYPVHPMAKTIQGQTAYASLSDILGGC